MVGPLLTEKNNSVSKSFKISQFNGNASVMSNNESEKTTGRLNSYRVRNALVATDLSIVTVCNMRSLFPKIKNFTTDFLERAVDIGMLSEIWEKLEDKSHQSKQA